MSKIYCVYHRDCDGFGAAYAFWKYLKLNPTDKKVKFLSANYDDTGEFPNFKEKSDIYIFDFCYPREVLLKLKEEGHNILLIDHHKTSMSACGDLEFTKFDMSKSGCVLTWEHFFPTTPVPKLLKYIQDRDIWLMETKEETEKVNAVLISHPYDFNIWETIDKTLEQTPEQVLIEGKSILRYQNQTIKKLLSNVRIGKIEEHAVPIINSPVVISEVCHELLNKFPEYPFVASYFDKRDLRIWSLRGRGDFDCSELAKSFGGGGHKNAAGWEEKIVHLR